jgi:hypothetical protein
MELFYDRSQVIRVKQCLGAESFTGVKGMRGSAVGKDGHWTGKTGEQTLRRLGYGRNWAVMQQQQQQ